MPLLYSLGQHAALEAMHGRLHPGEKLFAHLDVVWLVSQPERVDEVHIVAEHELWTHAKIQVHKEKTHVWNLSGRKPPSCDEMQRIAEAADPNARVWRGSVFPTKEKGIKILGCPLAHEDFVSCQLETTTRKHQVFLQSPQCLTSSLLGCFARISCVFSGLTWFCLSPVSMMQVCGSVCAPYWGSQTSCEEVARLSASLPLALGGLGLRSAVRTCAAADWASWADTLPMGRSQTSSSGTGGGQWICGAIMARLDSRAAPSTEGARVPRAGWAKGWMATRSCKPRGEAVPNNVGFTTAFPVTKGHVEVPEWTSGRSCLLCFARFSPDAFPASFVPCPLAATPCSSFTLTLRSCRCGRPLDAFGHHRAACSKSGVLGRRGFAVESAASRVCREAGARVATNLFVRDIDLGVPNEGDNRRLEVVADGLPLFGGVQLAIDATLVSAVQGDGEPTRERLAKMV